MNPAVHEKQVHLYILYNIFASVLLYVSVLKLGFM